MLTKLLLATETVLTFTLPLILTAALCSVLVYLTLLLLNDETNDDDCNPYSLQNPDEIEHYWFTQHVEAEFDAYPQPATDRSRLINQLKGIFNRSTASHIVWWFQCGLVAFGAFVFADGTRDAIWPCIVQWTFAPGAQAFRWYLHRRETLLPIVQSAQVHLAALDAVYTLYTLPWLTLACSLCLGLTSDAGPCSRLLSGLVSQTLRACWKLKSMWLMLAALKVLVFGSSTCIFVCLGTFVATLGLLVTTCIMCCAVISQNDYASDIIYKLLQVATVVSTLEAIAFHPACFILPVAAITVLNEQYSSLLLFASALCLPATALCVGAWGTLTIAIVTHYPPALERARQHHADHCAHMRTLHVWETLLWSKGQCTAGNWITRCGRNIWHLIIVFAVQEFDSTLGFPGEGPLSDEDTDVKMEAKEEIEAQFDAVENKRTSPTDSPGTLLPLLSLTSGAQTTRLQNTKLRVLCDEREELVRVAAMCIS